MHAQNLFAPAYIRTADDYAPVKTARAQQRRIQHIRSVRRCHQDDAFIGFEAVHLYQQLVQSLFALVVTAAKPAPR